jgi:hypothetical protein
MLTLPVGPASTAWQAPFQVPVVGKYLKADAVGVLLGQGVFTSIEPVGEPEQLELE